MGEEVTQLKGKRHSPEQIVCKPREATGSKLRVLTSTRSAATWGSRCRTNQRWRARTGRYGPKRWSAEVAES
jgi:hypothetical protein